MGFLHLASQIITTATLSKHLTTLIAKMVASGTQEQKKRPYFRIPLEWRNHAIIKDMGAVFVRDQAMKAQCVMLMMIVILNDATSVNFPLVADKRKLIRVSATVTATVNQIFAWVANVSMVDNDRCNSNDDCQSGRCAYGIPFGNCQAPAEHGEKCIRNNDCASQHCLLSTCTDHRDGAHCASDDGCLEGSSCVWSKTGATCKKNHGCTWWNWNE